MKSRSARWQPLIGGTFELTGQFGYHLICEITSISVFVEKDDKPTKDHTNGNHKVKVEFGMSAREYNGQWFRTNIHDYVTTINFWNRTWHDIGKELVLIFIGGEKVEGTCILIYPSSAEMHSSLTIVDELHPKERPKV